MTRRLPTLPDSKRTFIEGELDSFLSLDGLFADALREHFDRLPFDGMVADSHDAERHYWQEVVGVSYDLMLDMSSDIPRQYAPLIMRINLAITDNWPIMKQQLQWMYDGGLLDADPGSLGIIERQRLARRCLASEIGHMVAELIFD